MKVVLEEISQHARKQPYCQAAPKAKVRPSAGKIRLRAGDLCPNCQGEKLDYDGLLNLSCPKCGYTAGWGSCT